jgi:hypothetical protein
MHACAETHLLYSWISAVSKAPGSELAEPSTPRDTPINLGRKAGSSKTGHPKLAPQSVLFKQTTAFRRRSLASRRGRKHNKRRQNKSVA